MTFLEKAHAAVERRLGACSDEVEAWQLDHERAMRVFDCEDLLASMINVFDGIDELNRQYTNDVINGTLTTQKNSTHESIRFATIGSR